MALEVDCRTRGHVSHLGIPDDATHGYRNASQLLQWHLIPKEQTASHQDDHCLHMPHHLHAGEVNLRNIRQP